MKSFFKLCGYSICLTFIVFVTMRSTHHGIRSFLFCAAVATIAVFGGTLAAKLAGSPNPLRGPD